MDTHDLPKDKNSETVQLLIYIVEFSAVGIAVILLEALFAR